VRSLLRRLLPWPPSRSTTEPRTALPRTLLHWLSAFALWAVIIAYFWEWANGHWPMLTNPDLQQDDARTAIFPYHRWGPEGALADDPIANEMLNYQPWLVRALYFVFIKLTDIFIATKLVQALCILIVVAAAALLVRSRRFGLMAGLLLLFLFLRDWFVVHRIAGGLPRAFAFPCMALWLSAALTERLGVRRFALVLSALTYPSALAMLLGAEGLLALSGVFRQSRHHALARLKELGLTIALCVLAVSPSILGGNRDDGPVHTLKEAKLEPAFGRAGRLWILPFADPRQVFTTEFASTFMPQGERRFGALPQPLEEHLPQLGFVFIALFVLIPFTGLSPPPTATIAFLASSAILYFVACQLAFRLYSPERFYAFGMHIAGAMLVINVLAPFGSQFSERVRYPLRNFLGAAVVLGFWLFLGSGYAPKLSGVTINRASNRALTDFVATLPKTIRISGHPLDTDDIPWWSARATTGGFETLQPWLKGSWARQRARTEDTLLALYATDPKRVLDYADRNQVTHFLINRGRYGADFLTRARSFEPFNAFVGQNFKGLRQHDLVFRAPPRGALIFSAGRYQLYSVDKLRAAWQPSPSQAP
jgi:hypothetical protein